MSTGGVGEQLAEWPARQRVDLIGGVRMASELSKIWHFSKSAGAWKLIRAEQPRPSSHATRSARRIPNTNKTKVGNEVMQRSQAQRITKSIG
jgi:hypothetical protein